MPALAPLLAMGGSRTDGYGAQFFVFYLLGIPCLLSVVFVVLLVFIARRTRE
jgi:hypothetical protein